MPAAPAGPPARELRRLPDGVGASGVFAEGPQIPHILPYVVFGAHMLPHCLRYVATLCLHFPVKVNEGESWHFCDDPVCPDPVGKLPTDARARGPRQGNIRRGPRVVSEPAPRVQIHAAWPGRARRAPRCAAGGAYEQPCEKSPASMSTGGWGNSPLSHLLASRLSEASAKRHRGFDSSSPVKNNRLPDWVGTNWDRLVWGGGRKARGLDTSDLTRAFA